MPALVRPRQKDLVIGSRLAVVNEIESNLLPEPEPEPIPDIIEFVTSPHFLDRPNLYPRQATFLKVIFLQDDLFTQYDYDVIGEWEETFLRTGNEGLAPKTLERIEICKDQGRTWFRETLAVIGRRGSKGYTGALAGSYVLWNYMQRKGGPQAYYGIDRDKRLTAIVFAGKKEQAIANQWRDLTNVITGGPCFSKYIAKSQAERLTIYSPHDEKRRERALRLGVESDADYASFEIVPSPSTMMAGRGPASFMQFYDEMAHVVATGANRAAEQVYDAATPSLDQFGLDAFLYEPSSPWQMMGKFFENWEKAIALEPDGAPSYPEMLMLQLPSWGPYQDWEDAHQIPMTAPRPKMVPAQVKVKKEGPKGRLVTVTETQEIEKLVPGRPFRPIKRAIQAYDDQMRQLEKANPDTFAVERRSHWAESMSAYLNRDKVGKIFEPWDGKQLVIQTGGVLAVTYVAHGDPANSNKRFGWSIGHREWDSEREMHHVVFDVIRCWDPADFDDHMLDYDVVMDQIEQDVKAFCTEEVSFDQFNVPATIGRLRKFVHRAELPKNVTVSEVSRTRQLNWRHYELFKSAINMDLVHAPMLKADGEVNFASSEAELELRFLEEKNGAVDHPSSGPVQTKDIADTMCEVTVQLIGNQIATFLGQDLADIGVSGGMGGGMDPYRDMDPGGHSEGTNTTHEALGNVMGGAARRGGMMQPRSRGGGMQRRR